MEISEADASELGLKNGDKVRVKGTNFEAQMTLITKKGTKSGVAFIAENFDEAPVNRYFRRGQGIPRVDIIKTI